MVEDDLVEVKYKFNSHVYKVLCSYCTKHMYTLSFRKLTYDKHSIMNHIFLKLRLDFLASSFCEILLDHLSCAVDDAGVFYCSRVLYFPIKITLDSVFQ